MAEQLQTKVTVENEIKTKVTAQNEITTEVTLPDSVIANLISADFTVDDATPVTGQTVTFTDTSTGSPTSWSWDFGDGNFSTDQNPTHEYFIPGTYTVTLITSDGILGDTETKTSFIAVSIMGAYNAIGFWFNAKHGIIRDDFANTDINAIKTSAIPVPVGVAGFVGISAASASAKPTLKVNAVNGLPAVDFNGVDQYFESAVDFRDFFDNNDYTIIIVMKANSIGTDQSSYWLNDGIIINSINGGMGIHLQQPDKILFSQFISGGVSVEDTITLGQYFVVIARKKSDPEQGLQINNKTEVTRTDTNRVISANTKILIGRNLGTAYSDIEIAEMMFLPSTYVSNTDRDEIKTLLYNRYNITP